MLKRFWLLGGSKYYPCGGLEDFKDSFDSKDAAVYASRFEYSSLEYPNQFDHLEWWQVFDSHLTEVVAYGGDWFGNDDPHNLTLKSCTIKPLGAKIDPS